MKVYVYPADETGCGYYRLIWPARALRERGHDVVVVMPRDRGDSIQGVIRGDQLVDVHHPPDADVMVLQRVTHRHIVEGVKILRDKGVTVVVDIDDDLATIHPTNPAFIAMHPQHGRTGDHSWQNTQRACENATHVTVSTSALLTRYASHGRSTVLRNCVPARYLSVPHTDSTVIGWGGSTHSHPDDLQMMGTAITQLTRDGHTFRVVGPLAGVRSALHLDAEPSFTGSVDLLSAWPETLGQLGIGVAPLADSRFNESKSHLKPLELAALGVPCVMSPRAEYRRLHELGVGLLAERPREWLRVLRRLVGSAELRSELSERGRDVAREWTIEGNAERWLAAWSTAYERSSLSPLDRP